MPRTTGPVLAAALAAVALGLGGCTTTLAGQAGVDPAATAAGTPAPSAPASSSPAPVPSSPTESPTVPSPATTSAAPASGEVPIVDAGLPDDCLLTAAQMGALASVGPMAPEQTTVTQSDGQTVVSCFYTEQGSFQPKGRIQVYTTTGAPVSEVMDRLQGTPVPGVGDRAVLVRSGEQNLLWFAAGPRIATVRLTGGLDGSAEAFRTAGQQAAAALATR
ncbi:hypothetical protein [Rhodococcus aerolatus]